MANHIQPQKITFYPLKNTHKIPQYHSIPDEVKKGLKVVVNILRFQVKSYVLDELIDEDNISNEPILKLTFLHQDILSRNQYKITSSALNKHRYYIDRIKNSISCNKIAIDSSLGRKIIKY